MIPDEAHDSPPADDVIEPPRVEAPKTIPPQANGNGEETITDAVRRSRDVIPVAERGVSPQNYAQWIDIAKDVCKAYLMLPKHLHNQPAVMAGLLEIAARFRLSVYLLASRTYVQNDRLCFEAQAFGAILYASGLLRGRLRFDFLGEGEDMTCTVSGRFKDDPDTVCAATTPPLKDVHPGFTQKDGKTFVKGSPLWGGGTAKGDPEQQLSYFAERRWIRRYAPDACMGMFTGEEVRELDEYRAERHGAIPLSADRLGQLDTGEGWGKGAHVDLDLAAIEPEEAPPFEPDPEPQPPKGGRRPARKRPQKAPQRSRSLTRTEVAPMVKKRPGRPPVPAKRPRGRPPSRGEVAAAVRRAEGPSRVVTAGLPSWLAYVTAAEAWIKAIDSVEAAAAGEARWEGERDRRDKDRVPTGERSRLRALLDRRLAQFQPKGGKDEDAG